MGAALNVLAPGEVRSLTPRSPTTAKVMGHLGLDLTSVLNKRLYGWQQTRIRFRGINRFLKR